MSKTRIRIQANLEQPWKLQDATIEIDRGARTFTIRPLRSRRTYTMDLGTLSELIVRKHQIAEAAQLRAEKKRK